MKSLMKSNPNRWWDVPAILIMVSALWVAALRLQLTDWIDQLYRVTSLEVIGLVLGISLGYSLFKGRTAFWMGLVYTVIVIPWQLGLTLDENMLWLDRIESVGSRFWHSLIQFLNNKPVYDPILFLGLMLLLFWLLGVTAGYGLLRHANPWVPVLIAGGAMLIFEHYNAALERSAMYSGFFMLMAVLLLGRLNFLRSKRDWQRKRVMVDPEAGYDIGRGLALTGLIIVLVAWNFPSILSGLNPENPLRDRLNREWMSLRERLSNSVRSLRGTGSEPVEVMGDSLSLGSGSYLSEEAVFSAVSSAGRITVGRFYWRGKAYDYYNANGTWASSPVDYRWLSPGVDTLSYPATDALYITTTITFTSYVPQTKIVYAPARVQSVSRSVEAYLLETPQDGPDIVNLAFSPPLRASEKYRVQTVVVAPDIRQLRAASTTYPDWVQKRYLQVPANFSPRIAALAKQITEGKETPYDKAAAITRYLRQAITYTEVIPDVPAGRDPLEWFLFDIKTGFCNYYATSEVMMLRSLGIPARLAVGYAEGGYAFDTNAFTVRRKDSHAWPEVYFPGYGWVEFEPTAGQPALALPGDEEVSGPSTPAGPSGPLDDRRDDEMDHPTNVPPIALPRSYAAYYWATGLVIAALLGAFAWRQYRRGKLVFQPAPLVLENFLRKRGWRVPGWLSTWSAYRQAPRLHRLFSVFLVWMRVFGIGVTSAQTPAEKMAVLVERIPDAAAPAGALLQEYQQAIYSQHAVDEKRARSAAAVLRWMVVQAWYRRLIQRALTPYTFLRSKAKALWSWMMPTRR